MPEQNITKIGDYDVVGVIGEGGMGIVYKGWDPRFNRPVAIKMMTTGFSKNEEALRRFYNEAQFVGKLQHPNIVIVYNLGDQEGTPYLVMEYLDGESLDKVITARRELSIVEKVHIIVKVLRALHYAHQRGIVHRDIKPGNVMVMPDDDCKLVDFGIARAGNANLTRTGQLVGTLNYMSPEQLNGDAVDGRVDVWAAGVVLYELLTDRLPFIGRDMQSQIVKILSSEKPPPLSKYNECFPPELDDIIGRALAKDRDARYATAEEFAVALEHVEGSLKAQMVSEYIEEARALLDSDLGRARELLSRVQKVDTQNSTSKQMLYQVQQLMQQRSDQVQVLRSRAEEALDKKKWEDALALVDQARNLDPTNLELVGLREGVLRCKASKEQVLKLVNQAETAHQAGELEMARRAVDDALTLDPNDTQAKLFSSVLVRDIERRQRFEDLLQSIRSEVSSRHFEEAARLLREAEALRPQATEISPLNILVAAGREEQIRTERLEGLRQEAEQLLAQDQFVQAQAKAEEALRYDHGNRVVLDSLERIKTLQQNHWVAAQLAASEKLVAEGRITAALSLLEIADSHSHDARLQSQIPVLRQKLDQLKSAAAQAETIAREALQRNEIDQRRIDLDSVVADADSCVPATPGTETRTESESSENASGWQDDTLRAVERQLATFIGSLARVLVKKAACRTTDLEELYSILAASLVSAVDREAFLALTVELRKSWTKSQIPREPLQVARSAAPPNTNSGVEITAADVDHAARMLARHLGPIAGVLAKRAAQRADSLRTLYLLLAENVENKTERSRFLRDAGVSDL